MYLIAAWLLLRTVQRVTPLYTRRTKTLTARRARGFTLIEVLFTLVILGVLIAILAFNANATSSALDVRSGWLTLGQAQLAGRVEAGDNPAGYAFPSLQAGAGCISELVSNASSAPVSAGLTFYYDCASTGTQVVSVVPGSATSQYYTLKLSGSVCLVMIDNLVGTGGNTTFYGEDTSVGGGACNAANVGTVASSITSTQQLSPSLIPGAL